MLCLDCELAENGIGCSSGRAGVCGRSAEVAAFQNLLLDFTRKLARQMVERSCSSERLDRLIVKALTATAAGINFDEEELRRLCEEVASACGIHFPQNRFDQLEIAERSGIAGGRLRLGNELAARLALLFTGIRGIAVFYSRALRLGGREDFIFSYLRRALAYSLHPDLKPREMLKLLLDCGGAVRATLDLLDRVQAAEFGDPAPVLVRSTPRKGAGILVTGHDLGELAGLLAALGGSGINVYTHGEMLPAHAYPCFRKYPHLIGNYGGAWYRQDREFASFNGPVLMTTNCIVPVQDSYRNRIFTTGAAGYPGVKHIPDRKAGSSKDFSEIIALAGTCRAPELLDDRKIVIGFAHDQVLALADKVAEAVKSGAIRRFIVMAGCDGRSRKREYFTEVAEKLPKDTVILTAGCAKYRYNKLNLGDIGGIPRVLDAGQCNDSYSLAVIALKLKEVFQLNDVNDLPLSFDIAWYEQKAVAVLLALLALGFRNIRLGPTLPAFLSPGVAAVLVKNFGIRGISDPDADIADMLK